MPIRIGALLVAAFAVLGLAACKPSAKGGGVTLGDSSEVTQLRAEVARLQKENAELRVSPYHLAIEVEGAMRSGNEEKAVAAYKQLVDTFPVAPETAEMKKRLDVFMAQRRTQEEDEKRIAALGFKGLPVAASVTAQDTALTLGSIAFAKRWIFDS